MKWFRVEVSDEHGQIVAIESEMLAGRDIGDSERETIEKAIRHLSGFLGAPSHPQEKEAGRLVEAAKNADWGQVVANGGPPCFHIGDDGRFCLRAHRWDGHDVMHPFTTFDAAIDSAIKETRER